MTTPEQTAATRLAAEATRLAAEAAQNRFVQYDTLYRVRRSAGIRRRS